MALAVTAGAAITLPGTSAQAAPTGPEATYIVQMAGQPLAGYQGGDANLPRTKPSPGQKVDPNAPQARTYKQHLQERKTDALRRNGVGPDKVTRQYSVAFNGFAAKMTQSQADQLEKTDGVLRVWKDEIRKADTSRTPGFLGLEGQRGVWQQQFGGDAHAGEGMIIGDIDSGIWPESESFAALPEPRPDQAQIDKKWKGTCDAGVEEKVTCNNKLIGARYYHEGVQINDFEFESPRDWNSHGTHTASTAGGNHGVDASINGEKMGAISGMAPGARIAAYKALWGTPDGSASGSTVDLVSAIDDAVADGVDVINYSISGSTTYVVTPDELAFLGAASAGVFVATSAGNEGDAGPSTVAHNSPWTTTVAASTLDRPVSRDLKLGNGESYTGVGLGAGVGPLPLADSSAVALPGMPEEAVKNCFIDADNDVSNGQTPVLDPAKVKGKIVICARGVTDRTQKSDAVKQAGGLGMVLANNGDTESLNADYHVIPTVHVNGTTGKAARAYAATEGATATIGDVSTAIPRAPEMAGFSSYGPALAGGGDLLKPDITAPGSDILASVSPATNDGGDFNYMSGTSMSAPHIAGLATLVAAKHPTWSPIAVKSALMTTATTTDNAGKPIQRNGHDATALDYGAGHVTPAKAFDPGVVFDSGVDDWGRYACAIDQLQLVTEANVCEGLGKIDPSDFNSPSIAIGDLAGTQTVKRTVTSVDERSAQFRAEVDVPAGTEVEVSPKNFTLAPGESKEITLKVTRTSAKFGDYTFGAMHLRSRGGRDARSPIAVRPVAAAASAEVTGSGTQGTAPLEVAAGYDGTMGAGVAGLAADKMTEVPTTFETDGVVDVDVPAGTKLLRVATNDADYAPGTDLDLTLLKDGKTVGTSAGGTAEEVINLTSPAAGKYQMVIDNFAGTDKLTVKAHSYAVQGKESNFSVTPESQAVKIGQKVTFNANWTGLTAGTRYLGLVDYANGGEQIGRTLVSVTG